MFLYDEMKQENADLKRCLSQKDEEIKLLIESKKELEAQYTDLKTARTISLYDKDIKDTKQRLANEEKAKAIERTTKYHWNRK